MDTIFALASAPGKSGVSVVRISGATISQICSSLTNGFVPEERKSSLRRIHGQDGTFIDEALLLRFGEERSYTGEEVLELHIHGSPAVLDALLKELSSFPGTRLAEPGEFTRRALENGRMDLSQVDGLADLINAETQSQKRQAERLFQGQLGDAVSLWRQELIAAAALMQASIDFADEEIPDDLVPDIGRRIEKVRQSLESQLKGSSAAEIIRDGFEVAIVGAPNIGKSTLLNHLAGREAALTSSIAGTTRDVIEVRMNVAGYAVTFLDTAGVRESEDEIEAMGIRRGLQRAEAADLRLVLVEAGNAESPIAIREGDIVCVSKMDNPVPDVFGISGVTGHGVPELLALLTERLSKITVGSSLITRGRHRSAIEAALDGLANALAELKHEDARLEIVAEEVRQATHKLDSMVGKIGVEDVLDEVFSNFCLGK